MKKIFSTLLLVTICFAVAGQGKSGDKGKEKNKSVKSEKGKEDKYKKHEDVIWEGTNDKGGEGPKYSKNQPAKVRAAFQRDYPNAVNVRWSKYRGDWTATFGNGIWISTAVYHANGDRRDTRTSVSRNQLPPVILDTLIKKRPGIQIGDVIKIELPSVTEDIFRIKNILDGKTEYLFYNNKGSAVIYDY